MHIVSEQRIQLNSIFAVPGTDELLVERLGGYVIGGFLICFGAGSRQERGSG
jgi:hypothetical protein